MRYLKHFRVIAPFTLLLVVLTIVATVGGGVARAASLVTVSGPSPYASCLNAGEPGTNYVNAEVEPYVAVNPHLAGNIVGVWQQDRWNNGGAPRIGAGLSFHCGAASGRHTLAFRRVPPNAILDPFTRAPDDRPPDPCGSIR